MHELTHALQDQHFDLGTRFKALENGDDAAELGVPRDRRGRRVAGSRPSGPTSLGKKQRAALERSKAAQTKKYKAESSDIPEILQTFMGAPYALGEAMLALAVKEDGDEAVNLLFAKPPTTDEHLLDPWTLIKDREPATGRQAAEAGRGRGEVRLRHVRRRAAGCSCSPSASRRCGRSTPSTAGAATPTSRSSATA